MSRPSAPASAAAAGGGGGWTLIQVSADRHAPAAGETERWQLVARFVATGDAALPAPPPGAFRLVATDGGPPLAVLAVAPHGEHGALRLTVATGAAAGPVGDHGYRLLAAASAGLVTTGIATRVTLTEEAPAAPAATPAAPSAAGTAAGGMYLARDYPALLALLQAQLSLAGAPPAASQADVATTIAEVLAYAADGLSYYQDAVATEAYLGTARRRLSVRRHARQLGYVLRDGSAARAWVQVQVLTPLTLPAATPVLAEAGLPIAADRGSAAVGAALAGGTVVFETLAPARLDPALNAMPIYDWGDSDLTVPAGATSLVLQDAWTGEPAGDGSRARQLDGLAPGAVLLLEDLRAAREPGRARDRWPVRLVSVERLVVAANGPAVGPGDGRPLVAIGWHQADALPFPLVVAQSRSGEVARGLAGASGNLIAADQGLTAPVDLPVVGMGRYAPALPVPGVVHTVPWKSADETPASAFLRPDANRATASVRLVGHAPGRSGEERWTVRPDLLQSGPFARDVVVEVDDQSTGLRFGDGEFGRRPRPGTRFTATVRVGDTAAGSIAADGLATLVAPDPATAGRWAEAVVGVRNPLPSAGATAADPLPLARRLASGGVVPRSLAVPADYVAAALAFRDVDRAASRLETGGSWPVAVLHVRRRGGAIVDAGFRAALTASLADRMIGGRRLSVLPARGIGIDLAMRVTIEPGMFVDLVEAALRQALVGAGGFFGLSDWPLGAIVYASALVDRAMAVPGVVDARVTRFARVDRAAADGDAVPALARFAMDEYPVLQPGIAGRGRLALDVGVLA